MKKILHILNSRDLSGAENVVADICMMFKNEYDMYYCSPKGSIEGILKDRSIRYIPIEKLSLIDAKRAVDEYKPDIIHAHDAKATLISSLVSGSIPVISHLHGNHDNMNRLSTKSLLYLISTRKISKIVAVSKSCIEEYKFGDLIKDKSIELRNIIYHKRVENLLERDPQDYGFDFVFLGRLSYPKNPQRLAQIASLVLKQLPNARFGIIGEGDLKSKMEEVFKLEGVYEKVIFTGKLEYPYKALKQAKCLLMCSHYEGTPIAALEAMALGTPIVSTPIDGMKDLVDHKQTGFLSTDNSQLAEYVAEIILNSETHDKLSVMSVEKFKSLNDECYYKSTLRSIYNEVSN